MTALDTDEYHMQKKSGVVKSHPESNYICFLTTAFCLPKFIQSVKPSSNGCSKHSGYKHRSLRNSQHNQYILHCNQNSLKKHTLTLKFLWIDWLFFFFPLGPTETSVECYKWIFYMCLEGRIFHYNSSLTCIAAFYSSLLPNIAHGEFFKSLGFSHILNSSYLAV